MRRYRIGRAETNDIVLNEDTVSREHAELSELGGGRFRIQDLGSTSGLAVWQGQDWETVTEAELRHDAQLRIGAYQTTVADLLRDTDKTVVRPNAPRHAAPAPPEATAPPAEAIAPSSEITAPPVRPRPAPPEASRPAPPKTAPPSRAAEPASDATVVPATPKPAPPRPAPPARAPEPTSDATMPPQPPKPSPPRPASPRPAAPRPAAPPRAAEPSSGATMPPQPPAAPSFQFLRNLPPEKRVLVWLGAGFAGFLFIAFITLILALVL